MSDTIRILHFADAHIDIANYGRHDPETALPIRVMDFLESMDVIVETAVTEKVDLVVFAGDAYKDRNPQPTFQREWGKRIMKLSAAGIPTVLLVGNHDVSPASNRAHTLQEFITLQVPHVYVGDGFKRLGPDELGVPVQVITVPWVSYSQLMTREEMAGQAREAVLAQVEERVSEIIKRLIGEADPTLPLILTAHVSVQGAKYGSERAVMLGHELTLSGGIVRDKRLDYVALGHIHKHQNLNKGQHPPVIYPGSIERIDFGEAKDRKGFVIAEVRRGKTTWQFHPLPTRPFYDSPLIEPETADTFMDDVMAYLPPKERIVDAICRVRLTYPRDWEPLLNEAMILEHFEGAFSIQLQKQRQSEQRARLGENLGAEALTPEELLTTYWKSVGVDEGEREVMEALAKEILTQADDG